MHHQTGKDDDKVKIIDDDRQMLETVLAKNNGETSNRTEQLGLHSIKG